MWSETKIYDFNLFPVKSSYIFWYGTFQLVQNKWSYDRKKLKKLKSRKINYLFGQNVNLKFQNTPFIGNETKMDDSILFPIKSSYIFW